MASTLTEETRRDAVESGRVVAVDFGSTYTKASFLDITAATVRAAAAEASTVDTDVNVGLDRVLRVLSEQAGETLPGSYPILASSSAAGGLRVAIIGLTAELSLEAARRAALGAGAKVVGSYHGAIGKRDVAALVEIAPDIILLAGGTDGGDQATICHNSKQLAMSRLNSWFVVAGNRSAADDCAEELQASGKQVIVTDNLLPDFDVVNADAANRVIRDIFMAQIIDKKGILRARQHFWGQIEPTPHTVLEAARLIADGVDGESGLGPLIVVDVGGATTDVYSISPPEPAASGIFLRGLLEPYAKRTVEGDLGLRVNAITLVDRIANRLGALDPSGSSSVEDLNAYAGIVSHDRGHLPENPLESTFDSLLARGAVTLAVERHAGRQQKVYTPTGAVKVQTGKDLREIHTVIGVGGVFVHSTDTGYILEGALASNGDPETLRPEAASLLVDDQYILYAVGLLATVAPLAALRLGKRALRQVRETVHHRAAQ